MVKFWDIPIITAGALAADFGLPKYPEAEYYLLTRTGLSFDEVSHFMVKLFKKYDWKTVLVIYDSNSRTEVMKEDYGALFAKALIDTLRADGGFSFYHHKMKEKLNEEETEMMLKEVVGNKYA
ncbi:atrial natriuretic peptide receptor 3-like protein, partial [Dinothrombium tinctorium]